MRGRDAEMTSGSQDPRLRPDRRPTGPLRLHLSGRWSLEDGVPSAESALGGVEAEAATRLEFEASGIESWDSSLPTFVHGVASTAARRGVEVDLAGLPEGVRKLLTLATAVPAPAVPAGDADDALLARVGRAALAAWHTASDALTFLGEAVLAVVALLRGRARFRPGDLLRAVEQAGVGALGIVALINFLIGAVLAFVGAIQLQQFGASLYVANLVAIGVTRELGALMTGIVMCGRTSAAYAATLGSMTVNEEVDALRTMGLRPMEFLALPRLLATTLMLPALVVYADVLGIMGGAFVGVALLDQGAMEYWQQTRSALALRHVIVGLTKSVAFGAVVALTGCYYGLRCGRSAAAVGQATTRAVVAAIVLVVIVDALFTVGLHFLGV